MNNYKETKGKSQEFSIFSTLYRVAELNTKLIIRYMTQFSYYIRNLLGEDLGPLSSKELESLERQLDMSLKQIRSTRVFDLTTFLFIQLR